MKNKKAYIILLSVIAVAVMIWNMANEPGIKDLQGDFREVAFVRNEQNSGPVIRLYAVTVSGEYWKEMEQYGNYMPHTKYGTTRIYFFSARNPFPEKLTLEDPGFAEDLREYCIAIYEKDGMSQASLKRYPYR